MTKKTKFTMTQKIKFTTAMLFVLASVAHTHATILAFLGVINLINMMYYVVHRILNKKHDTTKKHNDL